MVLNLHHFLIFIKVSKRFDNSILKKNYYIKNKVYKDIDRLLINKNNTG